MCVCVGGGGGGGETQCGVGVVVSDRPMVRYECWFGVDALSPPVGARHQNRKALVVPLEAWVFG